MPAPIEVVIVNFNAGATLGRCLQSLYEQSLPLAVTVIDNASTDGSPDAIARAFGGRADFRLVCNDGNPGFAAAVNRAVSAEDRDYLLLLNPDCDLQAGALGALCEALERDPRAGLAGPLVTDADGRPQRGTLRRFPDPWRSFLTFSGLWRLGGRWPAFRGVEVAVDVDPEDSVVQAEAVSGACMLLRKRAFEEAGRMDPNYGLHCEDLDLMYRLHQNGWHCLYAPAARVIHHQGVSSASRPLWVHWQKHRGMQRFYRSYRAARDPWPLRGLVYAGIWSRFAVTLPLRLLRR